MLPILFSVGSVPVSSFGFFLALGFLAAMFVSWRLAKAYDLDEGKILDLGLLTFFGGLIFARAYFVFLNINYFNKFFDIFLINLYPGLSIWGAIIGGAIFLKLLSARAKLNFWQIADIASVGLIVGLVFGSGGCLLGGCGFGGISSSPIAVSVAGLIGKRFPVPIFEGFVFLIFYLWLWKQSTRFHFNGKIVATALTFLGIEKFLVGGFRGVGWNEQIAPLVLFFIGIVIYYNRSKRSFSEDLSSAIQAFVSAKKRSLLLQRFVRYCYNTKIGWKIKLNKTINNLQLLPVKLKRKLNVKSTPRNY